MSLPTITAIGNISRMEQKYLPNGKEVTKFQVECSEKNSKGEWENLYLKGEVWEKASQFLNNYFKDGDVVIVTGKLHTHIYEKQGGTKVYENKLLFPNVSFAPKPKQDNQQNQQGYQQGGQVQQQQYNQNPPVEYQNQQNPSEDITDTIPF